MSAILNLFSCCKKKATEEEVNVSQPPQDPSHRVVPSTMSFDLDTSIGQMHAIQALRGHTHNPSNLSITQIPGAIQNPREEKRKARRNLHIEIVNAQPRVRLSLP